MARQQATERLVDRVVGELRRRINDGIYAQGQLLPGEIALAQELHVSRDTLRRALHHLRTIAQVVSHQGRGWLVVGGNVLRITSRANGPVTDVCLLFGGQESDVPPALIAGLRDGLQRHGLSFGLHQLDANPLSDSDHFHAPDGLLGVALHPSVPHMQALARSCLGAGLATVAVDGFGEDRLPCDSAGTDGERFGAAMCDTLVDAGCRQILLLSNSSLPLFCSRRDGFLARAHERRIPAEVCDCPCNSLHVASDEELVAAALQAVHPRTVLGICGVHMGLAGQVYPLLAGLGWHPGRDVHVLWTDPEPNGLVGQDAPGILCGPGEPMAEIGEILALRLIGRLRGDRSPPVRSPVWPSYSRTRNTELTGNFPA